MSVRICCVCDSNVGKYKCPKCKQQYCSVPCCNKHKENCIEIVETKTFVDDKVPTKTTQLEYDFPTEDTVPIDQLEKLRYNEEVKNSLQNPQVRDIITSIMKAKDPTKAIADAMTEPIFVELADACLKVVEPPDEEKPC